MADKVKDDIIEEQRKARAEFLKLKKMQNGEIAAGPKPSEMAIIPKTPKEKLANFWFQYKWYIIVITVTAVILSVLISQCATKKEYDIEVVYFSYKPILDAQTDKIADYFEEYATDVNGDGQVNVQVVNCSYAKNTPNLEYRNTVLTKLQSLIAADEKAMLFITDHESITYFDEIFDSGDFFASEPVALGPDFYEKTKNADFGTLPEGLQISCRNISGTILAEKKTVKRYFEEAQNIIKKIK